MRSTCGLAVQALFSRDEVALVAEAVARAARALDERGLAAEAAHLAAVFELLEGRLAQSSALAAFSVVPPPADDGSNSRASEFTQ